MTIPFYGKFKYTSAPQLPPECSLDSSCPICKDRRTYRRQVVNLNFHMRMRGIYRV